MVLPALSSVKAALLAGLLLAAEDPIPVPMRLGSVAMADVERMNNLVLSAFRRLGIPAEVVLLPAERSLRHADCGLLDGDTGRVEGLEARYPNLVRVPSRVGSAEVVALCRDALPPVKGWEDLRPYRIGYPRGFKAIERQVQGMKAIRCRNLKQLGALLRVGRIDVVIISRRVGQWPLLEPGLPEAGMRVSVLAKQDLFLYVHRKHAHLVPRLAEAIRQERALARNAPP